MSIPQIAELYGVSVAAVRQWQIDPACVIPYGKGRALRLYHRADVVAYAESAQRKNRLHQRG